MVATPPPNDFAAGMERAAEIAEKELRRLARHVKGTGGDDDCAAARAWTAHRIVGAIRRAAKTREDPQQ